MLRLQILISLLGFCFASSSDSPVGRIVGGIPADIKDFPYQVSYQYKGEHFCGALIIDKEWVVTAAHCVYEMSHDDFSVRAGSSLHSSGGSLHDVTVVVPQENYSGSTVDSDIALAKVSPPFVFSDTVKAIELQEKPVEEGTMATVTGWGLISENDTQLSSILRQVTIPIVNHDKCDEDYDGKVTRNMLCAGYDDGSKDTCRTDSGGPLTANGKLIGVVSWGKGCGRPNSPGIYTDISVFQTWIKAIVGIEFSKIL